MEVDETVFSGELDDTEELLPTVEPVGLIIDSILFVRVSINASVLSFLVLKCAMYYLCLVGTRLPTIIFGNQMDDAVTGYYRGVPKFWAYGSVCCACARRSGLTRACHSR